MRTRFFLFLQVLVAAALCGPAAAQNYPPRQYPSHEYSPREYTPRQQPQKNYSARGPVVMELFTTQGCPSCPAADALLADVVRRYPGRVLALSCHVTYFDRETWRDPDSRIFCDARQQNYKDLGIAPKIFTPLAVIGGTKSVVGSHSKELGQALTNAPATTTIGLARIQDQLDIRLPDLNLANGARLDVWLFAYDDGGHTRVNGGGNRGKTVPYVHVVRSLTKLLAWNGHAQPMAFPVGRINADHYAVIAQDPDTGAVLAAGSL